MKTASSIGLFDKIADENVIYAFHGDFNYQLIDTLLSDLKNELNKSDLSRRVTKKTYKILVECLENIYKHGARNNHLENNEGLFVLSRRDHGYLISIGNAVKKDQVSDLKAQIDEVNQLSRESLKKKYMQSLLDAKISEKGGAGLGLIDIAMKSGNAIKYTFSDYKNNTQFFSLELLVQEEN